MNKKRNLHGISTGSDSLSSEEIDESSINFSEPLVDTYQKNANHSLAIVCRWVTLLILLIGVLNHIGVFVIEGKWMYIALFFSLVVCLLPTLLFDILKYSAPWTRYFLLAAIVVMCGLSYAIVSYHSIIMLVFPLICACLYGERKMVIYTILISIPIIIAAHLIALQLKIVPDEPLVTLHGVIFYGILPRLIQFIAVGIICASVTGKLNALVRALVQKSNELYTDQQMLISSLSELIEAQSQETGFHVKRVSEYTRILCEGLGYNAEDTWKVSVASMMHDVGKLLVPGEIIEKPGRLTPEEFEKVKLHVDYGKKMLQKSPGEIMQLSAVIASQHHEKWDGTGYKHLMGEEISPYARCVAVADVFDALVSVRPYKNAWTAKEAYDEIVSQSGRHFDPKIVDVFRENFEKFEEVLKKYPDSGKIKSVESLFTTRPQ